MTAESHALSLCAPPRPCVHVRVFVQARCVCVVCVCVCVCVCLRACVQRSKSFIHYAALFFVIPGVAFAARPLFMGKPVDEETLKVRVHAGACAHACVCNRGKPGARGAAGTAPARVGVVACQHVTQCRARLYPRCAARAGEIHISGRGSQEPAESAPRAPRCRQTRCTHTHTHTHTCTCKHTPHTHTPTCMRARLHVHARAHEYRRARAHACPLLSLHPLLLAN